MCVYVYMPMHVWLFQSAEAETTYKACVAEANHRQRALEKVKVNTAQSKCTHSYDIDLV